MVIVFPWQSDKRCVFKRALKPIQNAKLGQRRKKEKGEITNEVNLTMLVTQVNVLNVSNLADGSYLNFSDMV